MIFSYYVTFFFFFFFFFFSSRRRHTRYIGDWSSDVCSSDLTPGFIGLSLGLDRLRTTAILQKVRYAIFSLSEVFYEWRFGIVSDKEILADDLGITDSACHDYLATGYLRFRQLMKYIAIRPDEDVFLDF